MRVRVGYLWYLHGIIWAAAAIILRNDDNNELIEQYVRERNESAERYVVIWNNGRVRRCLGTHVMQQ